MAAPSRRKANPAAPGRTRRVCYPKPEEFAIQHPIRSRGHLPGGAVSGDDSERVDMRLHQPAERQADPPEAVKHREDLDLAARLGA
jgi:hypothetical protein